MNSAETSNDASGALVSSEWLAARANDPTVRVIEIAGMGQEDHHAYTAGHVPGAVCWDWKPMLWDDHAREFPSPEEFARRLGSAAISNTTTVVVYGEDIQFGLYAWWTFRYCGHADVRVLDGGRHGWTASRRKLVTEIPPLPSPAPYRPAARREEMRIRRAEVFSVLRDAETVIIDARSPEEYRGERVGAPGMPDVGAVRAGRIPGARHLYFADLLTADKRFKPRQELVALVAQCGVRPGVDVIAYCRMSHRATLVAFALTELLGNPNVRVYDGSWTEWGNLVGAPIER
jgi:thiosulfate/3-mercaptopyruvate sulfurtransferase